MSTKSSIAHGDSFHFYREAFDDDAVYLELSGVAFEAGQDRVVVPIPVTVWELIRRHRAVDFEPLNKTDAELRTFVEQVVDERLALPEGPARRLSGLLVFGDSDASRDRQIESGLDWYRARRRHLQSVKETLEELERQNPELGGEGEVGNA